MTDGTFSQREGITAAIKLPQIDTMDTDLRNSLWNAILEHYLPKTYGYFYDSPSSEKLHKAIFADFFKIPIDMLPSRISDGHKMVRERYFQLEWYEVYDFVEFMATKKFSYSDPRKDFMKNCNQVMERENSAYRFVSGFIVKLTSKKEIKEVEKAIESPVKTSSKHIQRAVELLSDRNKPDYRNSIKESISAVEAVCQKISGKPKATLTNALDHLSKAGIIIRTSLKSAFEKIYGYASTSSGIRHALSDQVEVTYEDAQFMLISCSSFTNYLISKAQKSTIL